jgi:hypothetical protein
VPGDFAASATHTNPFEGLHNTISSFTGLAATQQTLASLGAAVASIQFEMPTFTTCISTNTYEGTTYGLGFPSITLTATTVQGTITMTGKCAHDKIIWTAWQQNYLTTGTCAVPTCNNSICNTLTWNTWNDNYTFIADAVADAERIQRYSRRQLSEAELRVEIEREQRMRKEAEERVFKAQQATKRAERLLRMCLSPQQIEDLDKKNCFYVELAGRGGKKERYRIDRGTSGNVKQLDESGSIIRSFCVHPSGVPEADTLLTQKLFLEASDETRAKFWETANITELKHEKMIPAHVPRHERRRYAEAHGLLH